VTRAEELAEKVRGYWGPNQAPQLVMAPVLELVDDAEALAKALDAATWYVACLEGVQAREIVRGLTEAKAGYESALARYRGEK
jgi:hypothetical protein